jgi:hypothetical protein
MVFMIFLVRPDLGDAAEYGHGPYSNLVKNGKSARLAHNDHDAKVSISGISQGYRFPSFPEHCFSFILVLHFFCQLLSMVSEWLPFGT